MKDVIEIKEEVRTQQGDSVVILEAGDKIRVIQEAGMITYGNQKIEVIKNKPNWSDDKIADVLYDIENNFDSLNYSMGYYNYEVDGFDVKVACIPLEGSVDFESIMIY